MSGLSSLLRWTAVRLATTPATWVLLALLWATWGGVRVLSPIGLTAENLVNSGLLYELAFLAVLAGGALALGPLGECAWLLERTAPSWRPWLGLGQLLTGSLLGLFLGALLPAAILVPGQPWPPELAVASLLGCLHVAALGLLIERSPLPTALRPLGLAFLAWALPALLEGAGGGALLDAGRHWRALGRADTLGPLLRGAAAVAAWLAVVCWLLPASGARGARPTRPR